MKTKVMIILAVCLIPVLINAQENKKTGRVITQVDETGVSFTVPRTNMSLDSAGVASLERALETKLGEIANQEKSVKTTEKPVRSTEEMYKPNEKLKDRTVKSCPMIEEEQLQKILKDVERKAGGSLFYYMVTKDGFDVKCFEKAELDITIERGSREKPGIREFSDTVFFFLRDKKYDDGFDWYEWMVLAYDINTGNRVFKHDFDTYTDTITLTNVLNPQEKFTYDGRVPR